MHILYFHQHFATPQGTSGTRSYEFARALLAAGHQVTMVRGENAFVRLNLPYDQRAGYYRGLVDGIDVISLPLSYSNRDSLQQRTLSFLRFAWRSVLISLREQYDLVFATSTPLTAGIPGIAARWLRGKPFIFEVRDLWPELPRALGMRNPFLLGGMSLLEWLTYQSAHACIGLSPGIVAGIKRRSQRGKPVAMIPNGCDLELFKPQPEQRIELPGISEVDFVAAFTGSHGIANGLDAVLDAAAILKQRGATTIKLLFIGDGNQKDALVQRAHRQQLDNCIFLPPIAKTELAALIGRLDCGLMILKNLPAFYYGTSPNKFFDYIAAGIPVLNNYPGWLANLISEHACGVAVAPDAPVAFAEGLLWLQANPAERQRMGLNARALAEKSFAREKLAREFVSFLEDQV
ncbi:glycosyltransferase family 4 protein [Candidatus Viridilinea mediisalina]|uniref:Glycosyltransferase WbuB n=1 Tax=Candidatus Viridilinea mediisalina TaxID=2024553 RepID=A0A2A6RGK5_9CHLR|nr:glycosyltransferase family 4 protein [Candidatus Viridilinea mediisalina]PDW02019.1 glycosyltransferase WbuB [Candidatus Viridilinea mediisalina]